MDAVIFFIFVRPFVWRAGAILLLLNERLANFKFVIVTKVCPLHSINKALYYFMTISREMPVELKKIQKKLLQEIEKRIACAVHLSETRTV